jgi:hypothetical protein
MTVIDTESPRALDKHLLDRAQPPTELAGSAPLHSLPINGVVDRCLRPYRELLWIRVLVRGQAAEIVAALGPAALEIIADFRARKWALIAEYQDDPVGGELARARAGEWQRIATSVSMLMTL